MVVGLWWRHRNICHKKIANLQVMVIISQNLRLLLDIGINFAKDVEILIEGRIRIMIDNAGGKGCG